MTEEIKWAGVDIALEGGNFLFKYSDLRKAVNREMV